MLTLYSEFQLIDEEYHCQYFVIIISLNFWYSEFDMVVYHFHFNSLVYNHLLSRINNYEQMKNQSVI
ncbi:hypothetical protein RJT34_31045 [Clitoria ternatea]|uniref:Uncharacterized protein n=1 Tax=Clitoria ternatea TaxID=43366 RepID=A0AAN9I4M7_CLITE